MKLAWRRILAWLIDWACILVWIAVTAAWCESRAGSATPGKRALRLRVSAGVWILIAVAYVIPVIYVASLFVAEGRTPYDRITGLNVELEPRDLSLDAGS